MKRNCRDIFVLNVCTHCKNWIPLHSYEEKYVTVNMELLLQVYYVPCEMRSIIWFLWAVGRMNLEIHKQLKCLLYTMCKLPWKRCENMKKTQVVCRTWFVNSGTHASMHRFTPHHTELPRHTSVDSTNDLRHTLQACSCATWTQSSPSKWALFCVYSIRTAFLPFLLA